tara:strand:+ start:17548 stop:18291 length:744 start_codon:yes stop_codon:yes gene_type:complete
MKRHKPLGLSVATNTTDILDAMWNHHEALGVKNSNQTHEKFWTYDISCNEDFVLHLKHHAWEDIFGFFRDTDLYASMATKYVNMELLKFNPQNKVRVRMSLMPEEFRKILEPNTSSISERVLFINMLLVAGYDVHVNFSPVIVTPGALKLYEDLFRMLDMGVEDRFKDKVKAEVIFLTHNEKKHLDNIANGLPGEDMLWRPDMQENKTSQYGGKNLRYKWKLKKELIKEFKQLHKKIIPWNTIRYIF